MVGGKIEVLKRSADSEENRIDMLLKEEKLNIIVEDIGKEYLYETLFEKILGCSVKVIASGGKQASLKVSKEIKAEEKDYKNFKILFILDGDFDILFFQKNPVLEENLIFLEKYDIEAYFINKKSLFAALRMIFGCSMDVFNEFPFDSWYSGLSEKLLNLFVLFIIARDNNIVIKDKMNDKSVGEAYYYFCGSDEESSFDKKYNIIYEVLYEKLNNLDGLINDIQKKIEKNYENKYDIISGKYYICNFQQEIANYIKNSTSIKYKTINKKVFEKFLYNNPSLSSFEGLRKKIEIFTK